MRADIAAVERGLVQSRARAKELIQNGNLLCNGLIVKKPSQEVADTDALESTCAPLPYVGRGGLKLARALEAFPISLVGTVCMDIGASTGGFTDCMLQNGAERVYAVDVGHNQLAESLRADPRVVCYEGTDIRTLPREAIEDAVHFISIDVSFISLKLVLPSAISFLAEGGEAVVLVKPQFEAGRAALDKHGVVKSLKAHCAVLADIYETAEALGFTVCDAVPSGIRGGSGNVEYLFYLRTGPSEKAVIDFSALAAQALAQS